MASSSVANSDAAASRRQSAAHLIIVAGGSVLAATNSMISLTITPTTVLEIGGVGAISWTTTLYVVASIVAAAAGGLLRARLGLRGAALLGPLVFVAGGLVCAASAEHGRAAGRTPACRVSAPAWRWHCPTPASASCSRSGNGRGCSR